MITGPTNKPASARYFIEMNTAGIANSKIRNSLFRMCFDSRFGGMLCIRDEKEIFSISSKLFKNKRPIQGIDGKELRKILPRVFSAKIFGKALANEYANRLNKI